MKTKLIIATFFLASIGLESCQKDKCVHPETKYKFTQAELDKVPYKSLDNLTFVRTTSNDTFTFYAGQESNDYYETTTSEDCYKIFAWPDRNITFTCPKLPYPLTVRHFMSSEGVGEIAIRLANNYFVEYGHQIYTFAEIDSITVQGKQYKKVNKFSQNNLIPQPTGFYCYYQQDYGIVKMEMSNGEVWELLKYNNK